MMMNSPIPRATQQRFHQGSGLRSVRDGDRPDQIWKKDKVTSTSLSAITSSLTKLRQDVARLRRRIVGGGGSSSSGGIDYAGEYDPAQGYAAKVIVRFTPDGDAAGTYISKISVPAGIYPDTGGIYWDVFANGPQSIWA